MGHIDIYIYTHTNTRHILGKRTISSHLTQSGELPLMSLLSLHDTAPTWRSQTAARVVPGQGRSNPLLRSHDIQAQIVTKIIRYQGLGFTVGIK